MVGTGGIEPPTPSVSGKCSPAELRAFGYEIWNGKIKQTERLTKFIAPSNGRSYKGNGLRYKYPPHLLSFATGAGFQ